MTRNSKNESAKAGEKRNKFRVAYVWAWLWFFAVSISWYCIYTQFLDLTDIVLSEFPVLTKARQEVAGNWIATSLGVVAGVLVWWRITKVFVLHGSPIPWWMQVGYGMKDKGVGRRAATIVSIGDSFATTSEPNGGYLLYAAIFRPHPRSDKLMRSRLEYLVVTLPFGLALIVIESRFSLARANHSTKMAWAYRVGQQYWK